MYGKQWVLGGLHLRALALSSAHPLFTSNITLIRRTLCATSACVAWASETLRNTGYERNLRCMRARGSLLGVVLQSGQTVSHNWTVYSWNGRSSQLKTNEISTKHFGWHGSFSMHVLSFISMQLTIWTCTWSRPHVHSADWRSGDDDFTVAGQAVLQNVVSNPF